MDWIIGLQKAIDYIENNLTDTIDYEKVAAQSYSSSYHFQRVFSILCGFTIGEYIRNRRLSLAGTELATSDAIYLSAALTVYKIPFHRFSNWPVFYKLIFFLTPHSRFQPFAV